MFSPTFYYRCSIDSCMPVRKSHRSARQRDCPYYSCRNKAAKSSPGSYTEEELKIIDACTAQHEVGDKRRPRSCPECDASTEHAHELISSSVLPGCCYLGQHPVIASRIFVVALNYCQISTLYYGRRQPDAIAYLYYRRMLQPAEGKPR